MKNGDNIEKFFKEKFEHFEADVNPHVWTNVQSGIKSVAGNGVAAAAKFTIGKIIAGVAAASLIISTVWYLSKDENKTNAPSSNNAPLITEKVANQNANSTNQSLNTHSNTKANKEISSAVQSLNTNSSNNSQQEQISLSVNENGTASNNSSDENSISSSQILHKYGNSTNGPTALIRGNPALKYSSTAEKNNSASDTKDVEYMPSATILANTISGDVPLTVNFSNQGVASALSWDFGDRAASKENSPTHTFDKPGSYVVTLTAKNAGKSASDKMTITVNPISDINADANVFSPNGDGKNDFFFFGLKNIESIDVEIQDLAGHVVSKWTDLEGKWDGKNLSGADAPPGLYLYVLKAVGTDGRSISKKGSLTLFPR